MSEPKFTKGPWSVRDKTIGNYTIISLYSKESKMGLLAKMPLQYEFSLDDWIKNYNLDEVRANAQLISCAPEMYAMLEELATCGAIANGLYVAKIKKLLAKARGEG